MKNRYVSSMATAHLPTTVGDLLTLARARLADSREAPLIVAEGLAVRREQIYAHPEHPVDARKALATLALIRRRQGGEPVAYLLGRREFYGLTLAITPAVLIPRPETELLVDLALEALSNHQTPRVLDLGTGSGAIALAIAYARPDATVVAVDRHAEALEVAHANAGSLGLDNVLLVQGDWFSTLGDGQFDLVISNPPYVKAMDPHLERGDLRFEPRNALISGADGFDDLRRIVGAAAQHLAPGGRLVLEHGAEQQPALLHMLTKQPFVNITGHRDLAELPRAVTAQLGAATTAP